MGKQNYYELLGVSQDATQEEVKKAYKMKAKQYHPDVNQNPNATAIFQSITAAYEVLSDLSLRQKYDNELRKENRDNTFTTESSSQAEYTTQYFYYSSYTKTKEEIEFDFYDWLKEYLKRERKKSSYNDYYSFYNLKDEILFDKENIINFFKCSEDDTKSHGQTNLNFDYEDKLYTKILSL